MLQKELLDLCIVHRTVFHKEFSHLPRGLGHFAHCNSIPWNQTITSQSSLIEITQLKFLLSLFLLLFPQCRSSRIDGVSKFDDVMISLHRICQIPTNCQCKWLSAFSDDSRNVRKLLSVFWEVFVLHGCDWIHWVAESCTTIEYRWLCLDYSLPSLGTLWSAVIKSPNFSARSVLCKESSLSWFACRPRNFGLLGSD